jgi:hypothetical protein
MNNNPILNFRLQQKDRIGSADMPFYYSLIKGTHASVENDKVNVLLSKYVTMITESREAVDSSENS